MINEIKNNALLTYIANAEISLDIDVDTFLPSVGYINNGKITDFMFDSFIFLPSPNYLYDYAPGGSGGIKPLNKEQWYEYINTVQFKEGMNSDALNEAVGIIKKELGNKDYKVKVFMSLFYPHSKMNDFGEVDGENLDLANVEHKKKALKWMVDTYIEEFEKRNYENIEIGGFYWFTESISKNPDEKNEEYLRYLTDYVRSRGYITVWVAYFLANGHNRWAEIGFDALSEQSNYFPEHKNWPNQGGKERLPQITEIVRKYGCGAAIEMADGRERSAEIVNEYYDEGAASGWMDSFHAYYMSHGPLLVKEIANSENEMIRSAYDNTYRFIHKKYVSKNKMI